MTRRLALALVAALLGAAYGYWGRDYPPSFALILGAAIGTLVWAIQRTADRLRAQR